jgi:hypothetical protein
VVHVLLRLGRALLLNVEHVDDGFARNVFAVRQEVVERGPKLESILLKSVSAEKFSGKIVNGRIMDSI